MFMYPMCRFTIETSTILLSVCLTWKLAQKEFLYATVSMESNAGLLVGYLNLPAEKDDTSLAGCLFSFLS